MSARILAAAQTIPVRGDVGANVERHVRLATTAADERAQVVVFPELSLTGYELDLASDLAFSDQDARLAPLAALASARSMTLIVGAPVRIGPRLHIGAFILLPDGSIDLYTKSRLGAFPPDVNPGGAVPLPEAMIFEPGDRNPLVRFHGHLAAVAVCADTGRPSHPKDAAARGAKTYLASMFFTPPELDAETARLRGYAADHGMAVALASYGGPTGGLASAGGSAIWSERGELLMQLPGSGSGVAVATETASGWRAMSTMLSDR